MMLHTRKKTGGFTIVEIIIAIVILSILLALIVVVSGQMLVVTAKIRAKDSAMSLAQQAIEELRTTQNIPSYSYDDAIPGFPGYSRTITSTFVVQTSTIPYLWAVNVQVQGPQSNAVLKTYIQSYRPQVNFYFPSSDHEFISNKTTNLVGTVLTQTGTIAKSNVLIRTSSSGGTSWSAWSSLANNLYTTISCTTSAPDPLQGGTTYFFNYITSGSGGDGATLDIQAQATDSKGYYNFQPAQAQAGSSWIQLITDTTPPQLGTITPSVSPTITAIVPNAFTPPLSLSISASDALAGVNRLYFVIKRVSSGQTHYWDSTATPTPAWTTHYTYNPGDLLSDGLWYYPGTSTDTNYLIDLYNASFKNPGDPYSGPGGYYYVQAFLFDRVIGRYYNYKITIANQELASNPMPWTNVNANYSATPTLTLVQVDTPTTQSVQAIVLSPTSAQFSAQINPNGLPTDAWFEYGTGTSTLSLIPSSTVGTGAPLGFSFVAFTQTVNTLTPSTTYYYRVWARNAGGITTNTPTDNVLTWLSFQQP
jgi:prepilin-type N-terminal cleavage/methylation domain-containing protein